ncbi:type I restriction enzyme, S subunit [Enterococcus sp. AZ135]|uniref:restriction endonuclease subunit S n=1 Tax=Enterococcus TaxID=1350 RepID=UPI00076B6CEE|nr:restriction endonuclease subunit S [Enterococcus gallinarum]
MKYKLSELAFYSTEKIEIDKVDESNYVSTENILPNKAGICIADKLPQIKKVNAYKNGDILISNIRPYFKKIWFANKDGGHSADVLNFRAKEGVSNGFLYALLFQDSFFNQMVLSSKGTKMPRGDKNAIMNLEFEVPSYNKQEKIGDILFYFQHKIELNNQIISNLEELASTLFKQWFVDFEFPDENENPYKSSGGKMVDSELGKIPEGWEATSLSDIANYKNGLAMQKFRPDEDEESLPVLKIKELNQGFTDSNSDRCSIDISDEVKIENGDVVFSWSGTLLVKIWTGGDAGLNQHLFKVTSNKFPKWYYYLWTKFYMNKFIGIAKDKATTMGHIKRQHLNEAKVLIPSIDMLEKFGKVLGPTIDMVTEKGIENLELSNLRDSLLPKLLSGEIELPEDEEA